jgi:hypothetical protein
VTGPLDRGGACPQCGAPIVFRFAAAQAQVCAHCRFVIIRTDRSLQALGRVADLVAIPSPFQVGATGSANQQRFRIGGCVQYDRAEAASAPWQEQFIEWPNGSWSWLAQAQGRTYLTTLYQAQLTLPSYAQAAPGTPIALRQGTLYVTERGARRTLSGQGELPFPIRTDVLERYADLSGPSGSFGTIDYGDGSAAPQLYLGHELQPSQLTLDASLGPPPELAQVKARALVCPNCGGSLPLVSPETAERVVCVYCGLASDVTQQGLVGVRKLAKPSAQPQIPLGGRGKLRGLDVTCIAFLVRGTTVEGERYHWREYLLYGGKAGYLWLAEEDEGWQFIRPIAPGDVESFGSSRRFGGITYAFQQSNTAEVEHVVGEVYWKIEAGEAVKATEWKSGNQRLSEERTADEVVFSHSVEIPAEELKQAFSTTKLQGKLGQKTYKPDRAWSKVFPALLIGWVVITIGSCIGQADKTVFKQELSPPSPPAVLDDDAAVVAGKTCAAWRAAVASASTTTLPAGCQPSEALDRAIFTPTFEISEDSKNLRVEIEAPALQNSWVGADVALIGDKSGAIYERTVAIEYYSGVDGGESWSEGSRSEVLWFNHLPKGKYLVRFDPEWEANVPPPLLRLHVQSDTPRWSYAFLALGAILAVLITGRVIDKHRQTMAG